MAPKMPEEAERLRRRLRRFDPAVNVRTAHAGADSTSIDFDLGFPRGPMVRISRERSSGIGRTSVILRVDGDVDAFLIRYPPLPADEFAEPRLHSAMHEIAGLYMDTDYLNIRIQPGQTRRLGTPEGPRTWWPHVGYQGFSPDPVSVDDFADFLRNTYNDYEARYYDPTGGGN